MLTNERDPDQHDIDVIVQEMHDSGVDWRKVQRLIDLCRAAVSKLLAIREAGDEEVVRLAEEYQLGETEFHRIQTYKNLEGFAIVRGRKLREAREENERLKSKQDHKSQQIESQSSLVTEMQSELATLTRERDEARKEVEDVNLKLSGAWNLVVNNDEFDRCISSLKTLYGIAAEHAASHETKNAARDVLEVCGVAEKMRDGCVSRDAQIDTLTAQLAALKSAPGMEEVDALGKSATQTLAQIVLDRPETNRPAIDTVPAGRYAKLQDMIDAMLAVCRRSIASREEVVGLLDHILSCIITVKQENTPEWMEYIAEEVNKINEAIGDPDRVVVNCCDIVIVRGKSEIVEGK